LAATGPALPAPKIAFRRLQHRHMAPAQLIFALDPGGGGAGGSLAVAAMAGAL